MAAAAAAAAAQSNVAMTPMGRKGEGGEDSEEEKICGVVGVFLARRWEKREREDAITRVAPFFNSRKKRGKKTGKKPFPTRRSNEFHRRSLHPLPSSMGAPTDRTVGTHSSQWKEKNSNILGERRVCAYFRP